MAFPYTHSSIHPAGVQAIKSLSFSNPGTNEWHQRTRVSSRRQCIQSIVLLLLLLLAS